MPKHIGIVAVSAEGAALCYRTICAEGAAYLGPHAHPEITMHTIPLSEYMAYIEGGQWKEVGDLMLRSARKLADAGAQLLICPDNTVHEAFDFHDMEKEAGLPWLHIGEAVANEALARRFRKVGVLGTRFLMEGPVYPSRFGAAGVERLIPGKLDREKINQIIFDELVYGRLEESSRQYFCSVIDGLRGAGCQAVVLGCTEIPLLITDEVSPLPCLDSTRLLARAALKSSLETQTDAD
ncbi:MAG: amino acid racemase [Acidobacteria bacterium]|nr:MAG: amino acid racemase [Acidobacteriota bacterium]